MGVGGESSRVTRLLKRPFGHEWSNPKRLTQPFGHEWSNQPLNHGSCEAFGGDRGGDQHGSRLVHDFVAMSLLQSLERGGDLFARSIAARPQPQLTPARTLEHRQLNPHLRDWRSWLPFLDPRPDEPEQLDRAAQRMPHHRFA